MNYETLKKAELIKQLLEKDAYIVKVELMLKKANEATREATNNCSKIQQENKQLIPLREQIQSQAKRITQLETQPSSVEVLEKTIKNKDIVINKLQTYIDSYINATQETTQVLRGIVNMSDNAYKNILEEIKKG